MKTWVKEDDTIWLVDADGTTGYSHSKRVTNDLTFKYWDYQAWSAMTCGSTARVLSVGFGGGTFAQILTRWGTQVHGVGIEVDADLIAETREWVDLSSWPVIVGDFHDVLDTLEEGSFDAILVDVYDNHGYVKSAYEEPWIHRYFNLLRAGGRLLLHCVDPTAMLLALNLPIPGDLMSPLREWLTLHNTWWGDSVEVYVVPLWTTYLVWFGPAPGPISEPLPNPAATWIDQFFRKRFLPVYALPGDEYRPRSWTFDALTNLEAEVLQTVFRRMPWVEPLTTRMFAELAQVLRPRAPYTIDTIDAIILNMEQRGDRSILATCHAISFLKALKGDFGEALLDSDCLPFRFGGWLL